MNARAFLEYLATDSTIKNSRIQAILEAMEATGDRADTAVMDIENVPEHIVLLRLGRFVRSQTVSGADLRKTTSEITNLVSPRVAKRFGVVPFAKEGKTLHVAALDPEDLFVQDELALLTGCMVKTYAALELRIRETLSLHFDAELSPRFEGLLRRLSQGAGPTLDTAPVANAPEAVTAPSKPLPPKIDAPPAQQMPPTRPATPPPRPSELEISTEDLELFPSIAAFYQDSHSSTVPSEGPPPEAIGGQRSQAVAAPKTVPEPVPESVPESIPVPEPATIEDRLAAAAERLQSAEMRDDIADALLEFTADLYPRRMLLIMRGEKIIGWRGEGPGVDPNVVRAIAIPKTEASVFLALLEGTAYWLGPLPPMPRNRELVFALGAPEPQACLLLPIKVRGKIVAFLYGDAGAEPLPSPPMAELKRLLAKTDLAFQVYLLKGKIRTV